MSYLERHRHKTPSPSQANLKAWVALILLIVGLIRIQPESHFPGSWALAPTLSAALFISAGTGAWLNRQILSNRIAVWIGIISFPLYLWHWPILSFLATATTSPGRTLRIMAVLLSVVLAWMTYRFIERPARFGKHAGKISAVYFFLTLCIGLVAFAWPKLPDLRLSKEQREIKEKLIATRGIKDRMAEMYGDHSCFRFLEDQTAKMFIEHGCVDKKFPDRKTVFLIGDSHSASLSLGLRPLVEAENLNFLQVSTGWCEPTNDDKTNNRCTDINNMVLEKIKETKPELVIFNASWVAATGPNYFKAEIGYEQVLKKFIEKMKALGAKDVTVVGQIPTWNPSLPDVLIREYLLKDEKIPQRSKSMQLASLEMDEKMRRYTYPDDVRYISVKDLMCNNDGCLTMVGENISTDLVVWDYGHLTVSGAKFVANNLLAPVVRAMKN